MAAATERFASQLVCESEPLTHEERLEAAALVDALLSGSAPLLREAPVPRPLYWQDIVAPVPADRADSPSSSRITRAETLAAPASPETVEVGGADSSPEMVPEGTEERALFRSLHEKSWFSFSTTKYLCSIQRYLPSSSPYDLDVFFALETLKKKEKIDN